MTGFRLPKGERITDQAKGSAESSLLEVDGRELKLTNLDRVLYPEAGFTKRDLIDYYAAVAPVLIPHLRDRPITMRRFPQGVEDDGFWEKQCPSFRPEWVETAPIESDSAGRTVDYCLVNDLPTLVWMANLACIELHVSLAEAVTRARPTAVVFDLDPGPPADILDCAEIGLLIHETLASQNLESFAKVSGSKGIQVYVPLNTKTDYESTGGFAQALARAFEQEMPDRVVSNMKKSLRRGKVLIDWSQNSEHKTTVAVYSMRAKATPSVSQPVRWDALRSALDRNSPEELRFGPRRVIESIRAEGDPFGPLLTLEQELPS
ncbi:MAG: non-homologous end-joining DNA ligase [Actinomycetota bacterium]|nr:non-homologous end-joining DNA ligase [Actinomycetota bacterium]